MRTDERDEQSMEALFKDAAAAFDPPPGLKQRMKANLGLEDDRQAARPRDRWRLARRAPRIAAAAACMAILFLLWWTLGRTGLEQSAYAQVMQAIERTRAAEWVHVRGDGAMEANEYWISFKPFRYIEKLEHQVRFEDGPTNQEFHYDRASNTITVMPLDVALELDQKDNLLEAFLQIFKDLNAKDKESELVSTSQIVDGRKVNVFRLTHGKTRGGGHLEMWVDAAAQHIIKMSVLGALEEGQVAPQPINLHMSYPKEGPADLYAVGVPRDAKVVLNPPREVLELYKKIARAVEDFAPSYFAIICTEHEGHRMTPQYEVVYKKNGKYRLQSYSSYIDRDHPGTADMNAIERYLANESIWQASFILGQRQSVRVSLENGELTRRSSKERASPGGVEFRTWWYSGVTPRPNLDRGDVWAIVTPEDQADAGLILREMTEQGMVFGQPQSYAWPMRWRAYFDPQRDMICARHEQLSMAKAPWQRDPEFLKNVQDDPDLLRFEERFVSTVLEYARTPQGHWYPRKIRSEHERRGKSEAGGKAADRSSTSIITIHLDTLREIPDDLFDPDKLDVRAFRRSGQE